MCYSPPKILKSGLDGVLSVAASEDYVYWIARRRELYLLKGNKTYTLQLPGQEKGTAIRRVNYVVGTSLTAGTILPDIHPYYLLTTCTDINICT